MTQSIVAQTGALPHRYRRFAAQVLALVALVIMIYCAGEFLSRYDGMVERALWIALIGLCTLWVAMWLARAARPHFSIVTKDDTGYEAAAFSAAHRRAKRAAIVTAILFTLVQIEINGRLLGRNWLWSVSIHAQFALLIMTIVLLVWGLSDRKFTAWRWRDMAMPERREIVSIGMITLLALVLRLHNLEAVRAFVDEGNFLSAIRAMRGNSSASLLEPFSSIAAFPNIYPYFQMIFSSGVDSGLVGMRIPAAIFGSLTVPALYLLAKNLFDRRVAFVSAMLIATLPLHLQWSRLGMNNIADPLFGVLMLALLVRGARRGGSWHFALAGVCFGLTQYFYEGGRLVFAVIVMVWFLYLMLLTLWRKLPRRYVLCFLFSAIVIGGPIYTTLIAMDRPLTARFNSVRLDNRYWEGDITTVPAVALSHIKSSVMLFINSPESVTFYSGYHPYIHVYLVPFMVLGIGVILWRWRTAGGSLLMLWFWGVLLAISLLINGLDSSRIVVILPPLMMICALGMTETVQLLVDNRKAVVVTLIGVTTLIISVLHVGYYFGIHTETFTRLHYAIQPEQEIVFRARDLPAGTQAHLISSIELRQYYLNLPAQSLNPDITLHIPSLEEQVSGYIDSIPFGEDQVFYVAEGDRASIEALQRRFVLSEPEHWPNLYAPRGIVYISYTAVADRRQMNPP